MRLVATSSPWGIVKDTTIAVVVNHVPIINFKVVNACEGIAVQFNNSTTIGAGTLTYSWDFGDNSALSSVYSPTHLYGSPKGYKVTLKVMSNAGCGGELSKFAYQFAKPVANFDVPLTPVCSDDVKEVLFPNKSTISFGEEGALWSFEGGDISTAEGMDCSHIQLLVLLK